MKKIITLVLLSGAVIAFSSDAYAARQAKSIDILVDQLFQRNDGDGDGEITEDEAQGSLSKDFELVDDDGDGVLTRDEVFEHYEALFSRAVGNDRPPGFP
ncbi:MAG: hypothetical protein ACRBDL_01800 [Alphaproteobacteria bacterium]